MKCITVLDVTLELIAAEIINKRSASAILKKNIVKRLVEKARIIYKRKRKMNKNMKLTFIDIMNLVNFADERGIDAESYIDSSLTYIENKELLKELLNARD